MEHLSTGSGIESSPFNTVQTVHSLLGLAPGQTAPRFNIQNKLPSDMLIVDEASMIDLGMMSHILTALSEDTRLILLGDKDQLASVAPGAVLGDVCSGVELSSGLLQKDKHEVSDGYTLTPHIVILDQHYRFGSGGAIDRLGNAINKGRAKQALELLEHKGLPEISLRPIRNIGDLDNAVKEVASDTFLPLVRCNDPSKSLRMLNHLKLLTPLRNGPFGVAALNTAVQGTLQRANAIAGNHSTQSDWFSGRPIMITRNDYTLRLFNGDIGITMTDRNDRQHRFNVYFEDIDGGIRHVASEQLTHVETAFALTVHKSQGSEFDRVILVLPDKPGPILTRELLYTAVTRARRKVEIWGDAKVFTSTVNTNITRMSGLRHALWGEASPAG
jgi:exodeoxyribonuclease V alpha subunit